MLQRLGSVLLLAVAPLIAQTTVTLVPSRDTTIFSESGTVSNGAGGTGFTGVNQQGNERRMLVAFDLSTVPPGFNVADARLVMHVTNTNSAPAPISLGRVTAAWGQAGSIGSGMGAPALPGDATWTHSNFPNVLWSTPGGDFASLGLAAALGRGAGTFVSWKSAQMVADVQAWISNPASNNGWILVSGPPATGSSSARALNASEALSLRPTLVLSSQTLAQAEFTIPGCASNSATLTPTALPVLGTTLTLTVAAPMPAPTFLYIADSLTAGAPFTLAVGPCLLFLDPSSAVAYLVAGISPFQMTPGVSNATLTVGLPDDPALLGASIAIQAALTDGMGTAVTVSNGVALTLGR